MSALKQCWPQTAAASEKEAREFGDLVVERLQTSKVTSVHNLFRVMDVDNSGMVTFDEFRRVIRREMRVDAYDLPEERLWALFAAIDGNENGFICASEFANFLRGSLFNDGTQAEVDERMFERARFAEEAKMRQSETVSRAQAEAIGRAADRMEAEARRLEGLLAAAVPSRSRVSDGDGVVLESPLKQYELRERRVRAPRGERGRGVLRLAKSMPALKSVNGRLACQGNPLSQDSELVVAVASIEHTGENGDQDTDGLQITRAALKQLALQLSDGQQHAARASQRAERIPAARSLSMATHLTSSPYGLPTRGGVVPLPKIAVGASASNGGNDHPNAKSSQ